MQDPYIKPTWLTELRSGTGPRYVQIADMLERAVATGVLRPGQRLPAQRKLAELLQIDLTTVTRGLNEARRRQLIDARGPLGTFVSRPRVQLAARMDLSMNIPPPPAHVDFEALLRDGIAQVLTRSNIDLLMTYQVGGGSGPDRAAAIQWLKLALEQVDRERLVVCPGAQAALAAILLGETAPGDVVLTEPLVYPGLALVASQLGRRIEAVGVDDAGMRPDALRAACRTHGARLIYLNPTLQNPTAATMPEARRRDLVKTAAECDAKIIEDDPYWLLADDAPPPLARLMPGQVYYLSTLSKCLSPGLRTAFLALPEAAVRDRFLTALRAVALMSAPLMSALVTQWIHDGTAAQLLAGIKAESRARQQLAAEILPAGPAAADAAAAGQGIHLWHVLPAHWASQDLANAALREGLVVAPSRAFHAGPAGSAPPNAIRISLGGGSSQTELADALRRLANMLTRKPADHQDIVV
ncbi:GntR family transcriptional regulator [Burkholderia sp. WAC0059]|uniref:aminotransferase-like domain-containing protein n=1 Tax=Burkholderia sp. WAC0059 TaxID=2066022 RepID=UPI000C7EE10D|nr:PLP-dependent aminotransferase family protein [Burkholderia sp. WAC0059]PLZ02659.1 GntR family transcriptional regulator [Burkholderia sp. WAC0059]